MRRISEATSQNAARAKQCDLLRFDWSEEKDLDKGCGMCRILKARLDTDTKCQ
jgi:hypothetical protein